MASGSFYTNWAGQSWAQYRLKIDWSTNGRNVTVTATFYGSGSSSGMSNYGHTCSVNIGGELTQIYNQITISNNGSQLMGSATLTVPDSAGGSPTLSVSCPLTVSWVSGTMTGSTQVPLFSNLNAPSYCNLSKDDFQENAIFISAAWGSVGNAINNNLTNYVLQFRRRVSPEAVPSDWSGDWSSIPAGTTTLPTSGIVDVGLHNGFQLRVQARGTAGTSGYSAWTESNWVYNDETTPPSAPTYMNASINDTTISLAWGPSTSGIHNPFQYYELIYSVGTFGNNWQTLITTTDTTYAFTTGIEKGQGMFFGVRAVGLYTASAWVYPGGSGGVYRSSDCSAPTSLQASFTPTSYDTAGIYSFLSAGANPGVNNNIIGYELQFNENDTTWNDFFSLNNENASFEYDRVVGYTVNQGESVKFRIRTKGSAGVNYYSEWKESNIVINPTFTGPLSNVMISLNPTADTTYFEISISGEGALSGLANNVIGYDVEYRHSADNKTWQDWEYWYKIETSSLSFETQNSGNIPEGGFLQLRLRTVGEAGIYRVSEWTESNVVQNSYSCASINVFRENQWILKPVKVFVSGNWIDTKNIINM